MTALRWNRVTVVGCGLIGASFALALRRSGACAHIGGWDVSAHALHEARMRGIIDEVDQSFASGDASASELIYLAMPVEQIMKFLRECGAQIGSGAIITDAGSTKALVCREARDHLPKDRHFVGGHPVAGSHHTGSAHARADLFDGAPYVLVTDDQEPESEAFAAVRETIELLCARVKLMTAVEHDRAMALVSHLPQLLSSALRATVMCKPDAGALAELSGAGYRDMTRLAASSWDMWRDILATNPAPVADALSSTIEHLEAVRDELQRYAEHSGDARSETKLALARALFEKYRQA